MPELDLNLVRGVVLVLLIVAFLGAWAWAWSGKRRKTFEEASRLPLEEDDGRVPEDENGKRNGRPRPGGSDTC